MEGVNNFSGSSLIVPSVQELAKENITTVPQRYIQPKHEENLVISGTDCSEIPVIDMHNLLSEEHGSSELNKLHLACKDWGFFQLINHGVSSTFLEKVKSETQDFFNIPMSEKKKLWQTPQHLEGFGQAFVVSEDQKLDWSDMFYLITLPTYMKMPHLFSQLPLSFRETIEAYSQEVKNLCMIIIGQLEKALNMKEREMGELFEDGILMMRMNYYPPCPQPEKVIGITNHSDSEGLTFLLQLNEVEGLQIKKDGMWVPVKPLHNAFIVNIGDILEIMTNGIYRSIEHRAKVNSEKERLSIAMFYSPSNDSVVRPMESLISEQTPARFGSIGVKEFFEAFFAKKLEGKSFLDVLRIEHE